MDKTVDIDDLHAEINQLLPWEQQIQKGDPMYAGIVVNKVALGAHVHLIQKNLGEALQQMSAASEQQIEKAAAIAERTIGSAGNQIERQVDSAASRWEERLRKARVEGEASIRRACWLAWTGAIMILITACVFVGSYLGNLVFHLVHHTK